MKVDIVCLWTSLHECLLTLVRVFEKMKTNFRVQTKRGLKADEPKRREPKLGRHTQVVRFLIRLVLVSSNFVPRQKL